MTVRATMICDSVGKHAPRLSTILMYYPHVIHNELMTHRVFSRNAASSRAIPIKKMIQLVIDDPYIPPKWYKNQPGTQGTIEMDGDELRLAKLLYRESMMWAIMHAEKLDKLGAHKQIVNRILNPYMHILVLVSSTQWSNFLHVRDHKDAEPSMQLLGAAVRECLNGSLPRLLQPGEWHLPLTDGQPRTLAEQESYLKISVARCASVSHKTVEGFDMTPDRATALHDRLVGGDPMHASPTEHQARVDQWISDGKGPYGEWRPGHALNSHLSGNLAPGWVQYRQTISGQCR